MSENLDFSAELTDGMSAPLDAIAAALESLNETMQQVSTALAEGFTRSDELAQSFAETMQEVSTQVAEAMQGQVAASEELQSSIAQLTGEEVGMGTSLEDVVASLDAATTALTTNAMALTENTTALEDNAAAQQADAAASDEAAASHDKIGASAQKAIMPLALVSAAVVGTGAAAVHMAGDFQSSMTSLVTGAGESASNIKMVSDSVLNMAPKLGESTSQLSSGLYMIESAGYHGKDALSVLQDAAEGAKVGSADLGTVADATTTILNDYGSSGVSASNAVNALIATVASGKTHMQDLASSLSQVLPTASAAGIGLNDVMGAMATMTGEGVPAANAATYLRQTMIALSAPTKQTTDALASVGLKSSDVAAEMKKSLPDALQMITDAVGKKFPKGSEGYVEALKSISGGSKQMQGMLDLTGDHLKTFQGNTENITGTVKKGGDSIQGWALVQQDFNQRLSEAGATVSTAFIKMGTALMPFATSLIGVITPAFKEFGEFAASHGKELAIIFAVVATALVGALVPALFAFAAAQMAAIVPLLPLMAIGAAVALAVVGLALAFKQAYEHSAPFRQVIQALGGIVGGLLAPVKTIADAVGKALAPAFKGAGADIGDKFNGAMKALLPFVQQAQAAVKQFATDVSTRIGPAIKGVETIITAALSVIKPLWNSIWPAMSNVLKAAFDIIVAAVKIAWAIISGIFKVALDLLGGNWKGAWNDFKDIFVNIWHAIQSSLGDALHQLVNGFLNGFRPLLEALAHIPGPVGDMARGALKSIKEFTDGTSKATSDAAKDADMHTATMKANVLAHTAEMHAHAVQELSQQRAEIIAHMQGMQAGAEKAALQKQLGVVNAQIAEHTQQAQEAQKQATDVVAAAQKQHQQYVAEMDLQKSQAVQKAAEMKAGVLTHTVEMHVKAAETLDQQRQQIVSLMSKTTDGATQAALQKRLDVVNEQYKEQQAMAGAAVNERDAVLKAAQDMHTKAVLEVSKQKTETSAHFTAMAETCKASAATLHSGVTLHFKQMHSDSTTELAAQAHDASTQTLLMHTSVVGNMQQMHTQSLAALKQSTQDASSQFAALHENAEQHMSATALLVSGHSAAMADHMLAETQRMHTNAVRELEGQRNEIEQKLVATKDATQRHALEMQLVHTNAMIGMHTAAAAEVRKQRDEIEQHMIAQRDAVKTHATEQQSTVHDTWSQISLDLSGQLDGIGKTMLSSGQNAGKMLAQGLKNAVGDVAGAAKGLAGSIASFLGFHSPTEQGPGADADKWMHNLGGMLTEGLTQQQSPLSSAAAKLAGGIASSLTGASLATQIGAAPLARVGGSAVALASGSSSGAQHVQATFNLQGGLGVGLQMLRPAERTLLVQQLGQEMAKQGLFNGKTQSGYTGH